jgi:hypothetical protein
LELELLPSARGAGWLRWAQAAVQIRFCADFVEKFVSESICFGFCFIL